MDQVVGDVDALKRRPERVRRERVRLHELDARPVARFEHGTAARRGPHGQAASNEDRYEVGADVAGRTEHEDSGHDCPGQNTIEGA